MELFEQLRRDRRDSELSIRELVQRRGVHRRTVRQALASAVPPVRTPYRRRGRPAIDDWAELIDSWLIADQQAPRKRRCTARRVWQRLVAKHGAMMSEATVTGYVRLRRSKLGGLDEIEVTVPQTHLPAAEAEVGFGEVCAVVGGEMTKCWMLMMRVSPSGRACHVVFGTQAQEAFFEGHVRAFGDRM